ncbi:hypothetical protein CYMTET_24602 [Cymbomonas tetramitiformis]|uniref:Uncharacterized protein n=1 Tax=Cymbomonas tetramitiformis TaxID=36881 RepID=A0AAE0FVJ7_9CHLO|nr:hypothetical protein CYMTET_24602 [Cymbomonas tetramitiformis]
MRALLAAPSNTPRVARRVWVQRRITPPQWQLSAYEQLPLSPAVASHARRRALGGGALLQHPAHRRSCGARCRAWRSGAAAALVAHAHLLRESRCLGLGCPATEGSRSFSARRTGAAALVPLRRGGSGSTGATAVLSALVQTWKIRCGGLKGSRRGGLALLRRRVHWCRCGARVRVDAMNCAAAVHTTLAKVYWSRIPILPGRGARLRLGTASWATLRRRAQGSR